MAKTKKGHGNVVFVISDLLMHSPKANVIAVKSNKQKRLKKNINITPAK